MNGSIDPATGVFHVVGTSGPPPLGYPPAPPPTRDGKATADGNRFSGTATAYATAPHFIWVPFTFPMRGARSGLIVCGDGVRDPGEACDHRALNGVDQGCAADCTVEDPDGDNVCSALDTCPTQYDPYQATGCNGLGPLTIGQVRLYSAKRGPGTGRITLKGIVNDPGAAAINAVAMFRVFDFDDVVDQTWTGFACTQKRTTLKCKTADGNAVVQIKTRVDSETKLKATFKNASTQPSNMVLNAPVLVTLTDDTYVARAGTARTCVTTGSYENCTP